MVEDSKKIEAPNVFDNTSKLKIKPIQAATQTPEKKATPVTTPIIKTQSPTKIKKQEITPTPEQSKKGNVFTNLFPNKEKTDEKLVSSLIASANNKSILTPKKSDDELLIYKKPTLGINLLKLAILLGLLIFSYFYTQLSPTFTLLGTNPVQKRISTYKRVVDQQAVLNKQNFIIAKYALDDYLFTADSYNYKANRFKSNNISQREKAKLEQSFTELTTKMKTSLILASEKLAKRIIPSNIPNNPTGDDPEYIFKNATKIKIRSGMDAAKNDPNQLAFLRTVIKLVDNQSIKTELDSYQIPTMTDYDFAELSEILSHIDSSDFATLNQIRKNRIPWSKIIQEIEVVTTKIDPLFQSKFASENVRSIFYSSYNLNKADNSITVIGETSTDDALNFSVGSDLIDEYENSSMFKNVSMDSFSKAKENDSSYKGALSIDLTLE